jgi:hypothetical protein
MCPMWKKSKNSRMPSPSPPPFLSAQDGGGCPKRKEAMRIIHVKTTQKVTRERKQQNIVKKGNTFAEVIYADAVEKNNRAMTERRPSIRQEVYSHTAPAQTSTQQNPKGPKTAKLARKTKQIARTLPSKES